MKAVFWGEGGNVRRETIFPIPQQEQTFSIAVVPPALDWHVLTYWETMMYLMMESVNVLIGMYFSRRASNE